MDIEGTPIEKARNIGPKTSTWLKKIGIFTLEELRESGAEKAYLELIAHGHYEHKGLLAALIGAVEDISWEEALAELRDK